VILFSLEPRFILRLFRTFCWDEACLITQTRFLDYNLLVGANKYELFYLSAHLLLILQKACTNRRNSE